MKKTKKANPGADHVTRYADIHRTRRLKVARTVSRIRFDDQAKELEHLREKVTGLVQINVALLAMLVPGGVK